MTTKILVTFASPGGATAGVAAAIGQKLASAGAEVDVRSINEVTDLSAYQAFIIGSAIHGGRWMPEAMAFIERHHDILQQMPTAVFQVCMMLATHNEQYKKLVPGWFAPIRSQIRPVAEGSFSGALQPGKYPKLIEKLGLRIFLAAIKLKAGDYRDWDAIRTWTDSVSPLLISKGDNG